MTQSITLGLLDASLALVLVLLSKFVPVDLVINIIMLCNWFDCQHHSNHHDHHTPRASHSHDYIPLLHLIRGPAQSTQPRCARVAQRCRRWRGVDTIFDILLAQPQLADQQHRLEIPGSWYQQLTHVSASDNQLHIRSEHRKRHRIYSLRHGYPQFYTALSANLEGTMPALGYLIIFDY